MNWPRSKASSCEGLNDQRRAEHTYVKNRCMRSEHCFEACIGAFIAMRNEGVMWYCRRTCTDHALDSWDGDGEERFMSCG